VSAGVLGLRQRSEMMNHIEEKRTYVSYSHLPNSGCPYGNFDLQRRDRTNLNDQARRRRCGGFVETIHKNAGRDLDKEAMASGKKGVGQGHGKVVRLPEAVDRSATQRSEELVVSL
jgi:hypothetical protein